MSVDKYFQNFYKNWGSVPRTLTDLEFKPKILYQSRDGKNLTFRLPEMNCFLKILNVGAPAPNSIDVGHRMEVRKFRPRDKILATTSADGFSWKHEGNGWRMEN